MMYVEDTPARAIGTLDPPGVRVGVILESSGTGRAGGVDVANEVVRAEGCHGG